MATKLTRFAFGQSSFFSLGFSLIETLIVMSLLSILTFLALPGLKHFFQQQQLDQAARAWVTKIHAVRMRAMKTQTKQVLVWRDDGAVEFQFKASFGRNEKLTFLPSGFTQGQQGSFYLCLKNNPDVCQRIVVLASGVVRREP